VTAVPARRHWSILLWLAVYAVSAAIVLGANPFAGETITPFDRLVAQKAWSFVDPDVEVRQNERSDILNSRIPQWETAKSQIWEGRFPKWNDKIAGGGTFLTVNTNIFTPAFLVFAAAPDSALGFHLAMLLNLTLAGLGMHLLLRRYFSATAAALGALTFEFCGFNAAWLYWPHVFTLIWAPWLFWAIDRCAAKPDLRRCLPVAITTALTCLGGFPFVSLLVLEAGALFALILVIMRFREQAVWRFPVWYAAACVLGLLLASLPLAGLVLWLQQFDLGYRDGRGSYLSLHHLLQLLPPWAYDVRRVEQTMYIGLPMLVLGASGAILMVVRRTHASPLTVFGLALAIVATGLVAGLWPMWLLKWLPGMAFNSWSRAIGLLDFALIVLGSAAFDALWNHRSQGNRHWIRIALLVLAMIQVVEISLFFRSYNGPVPTTYYFPETPSIEYMRANAGPFDYVITDQSFGMSGTLGAYGLREWLAHYFRSPALQRSLHQMAYKPFNSSVASPSRFPASGIKFDSPAMAAYNIRYAAVDARSRVATEFVIGPHSDKKHVPLPPMPRASYRQAFQAPGSGEKSLAAISIRLATYRKSGLPGTVLLTVTDEKGTVLGTSTVNAASVKDNAIKRFMFDHPIMIHANQRYGFLLSYQPGVDSPPRLTAWSFPTPATDSLLTVSHSPHAGVIEYQLHFEKAPSDMRFRKVFEAQGTAILENVDSPRGPYFLATLAATPNAVSGTKVKVVEYRPDRFVLHYSGDAPGHVVVPMNAGQDWFVTVDNRPRNFDLKDGVMPAVHVSGPTTIEFTYRPRLVRYLLPWLLVVAGCLLALTLFERFVYKQRSS